MKKLPDFDWSDPLDLEGQLTKDERLIQDTARECAQDKRVPRVLMANREGCFDRTYEVTHDIHALILGRAQTGAAFNSPGSRAAVGGMK